MAFEPELRKAPQAIFSLIFFEENAHSLPKIGACGALIRSGEAAVAARAPDRPSEWVGILGHRTLVGR